MPWHTPRTWTTGELISAIKHLNKHIRDNLNALKNPPTARYELDQGSDYTTTSTTFVDIDSTNLVLELTTNGGDLFVYFGGTVIHSVPGPVYFEITLDGSIQMGNDGLLRVRPRLAGQTGSSGFELMHWIQGVSVGAHTVGIQWKVDSGTATLYAGAGTSQGDIHPQFFVREIS